MTDADGDPVDERDTDPVDERDTDPVDERDTDPAEKPDDSEVEGGPTVDDVAIEAGDPETEVGDSATGDEHGQPAPTPQSEALRRQQYYVAVGGGILGGLALMTGFYQRFPDAPVVLPVLAGIFGAGLVLWLAKRSVFPGDGELGDT